MQEEINKNNEITANSEQLNTLKAHFPQCFDKDGRFRPDKLEDIVRASGADITREGYKLDWLGKSYARLLANLKTETLLAPNAAHNALPENASSENLLIQGDNLDVLKHLVNTYAEKVKMIYIDPPYNTGSDGFVYNDTRTFTVAELQRLAGVDEGDAKRILDFTNSSSNSHSAWLTFMYPRLYVARELLREDGVIFISIDDNEQAPLKLLCDEVFGEENFVAMVPRVAKRTSDKGTHFRPTKDYIAVYARVNERLQDFGVAKKISEKDYKLDDGDGRKYKKSGASLYQPSLDSRPNQRYYVEAPDGSLIIPPGTVFPSGKVDGSKIKPTSNADKVWRWSVDTYMRQKDLLIFTKGSAKNPLLDENGNQSKWNIYPKVFLEDDLTETLHPEDVIRDYTNSQATKELNALEIPFSFSKPTSLLVFIMEIIQEPDALILDFFSGSGSTAHALMALNAQDGGNRKHISVQLDESTDKKSEARKAGYNTIFEITRERIKRAAVKIKEDHPGTTCDFGFKEFKTIPANEGQFAGYLDDAATREDYEPFDGMALDNGGIQALLTTWAAYDGIPLHQTLQEVDLGGYTAYMGGDKLYFVNSGLGINHITAMLSRIDDDDTFTPRKIVVFHYRFNDKQLREFSEAVNAPNRKHLQLDFIQRF